MKSIWKEAAACVLMGLVLPGLLLRYTGGRLFPAGNQPAETAATQPPTVPTATADAGDAGDVTVRLMMADGSSREMELETYLVGVVLAEMPGYFESEALKAQSVAARTYTHKTCLSQDKHDGRVCTDFSCCQAYLTEEEYLGRGGTRQALDKIRQAVADTEGMVLTYEGELIEATYFSCSGGSTEDARAVWGADFPYLRAVDSPGEENAEFYEDTVEFSREEFNRALGLELTGDPADWIGKATSTPGGGVDTIHIGGKTFQGKELRRLLGLRSTAFTMTGSPDGITVSTRGFGHRVGMSQYGADAMSAAGASYREILSHYYPGTTLEKYQDSIA